MSGVRVLVGTRRAPSSSPPTASGRSGTSRGPLFGGWEIYHMKGSPVDPNRIYARRPAAGSGRSFSAPTMAARPGTSPARRPASRPRRRRHAEGREQQVRLRHLAGNRQAAHHAPVVRRHAAPVGVQTRLASRTVAHRSRHRLRRRRRRGAVQIDRRRQELARTGRPARHGKGPQWTPGAGGMGLHTIILDPTNPEPHLHRHLRRRRFRTDDGGKTWKAINQAA